jgi:hypothetical protein
MIPDISEEPVSGSEHIAIIEPLCSLRSACDIFAVSVLNSLQRQMK